MLDGVSKVKRLDGSYVETLSGYDAGYVFVDTNIRVSTSDFRNATVIFLTRRDHDEKLCKLIEQLTLIEGTCNHIINKREDESTIEFRKLINNLVK